MYWVASEEQSKNPPIQQSVAHIDRCCQDRRITIGGTVTFFLRSLADEQALDHRETAIPGYSGRLDETYVGCCGFTWKVHASDKTHYNAEMQCASQSRRRCAQKQGSKPDGAKRESDSSQSSHEPYGLEQDRTSEMHHGVARGFLFKRIKPISDH